MITNIFKNILIPIGCLKTKTVVEPCSIFCNTVVTPNYTKSVLQWISFRQPLVWWARRAIKIEGVFSCRWLGCEEGSGGCWKGFIGSRRAQLRRADCGRKQHSRVLLCNRLGTFALRVAAGVARRQANERGIWARAVTHSHSLARPPVQERETERTIARPPARPPAH